VKKTSTTVGLKEILEELASRPMQSALYFCTNTLPEEEFTHYALNVPFYTHFTSPIRRYADVVVHRLVYAALNKTGFGVDGPERVQSIAKNCNEKKLSSKRAQQDSEMLYLTYFLKDHPLIDEHCIVYEIGKDFLRIYVPLLGIIHRVFLDGFDIVVDSHDVLIRPLVKRTNAEKNKMKKAKVNAAKAAAAKAAAKAEAKGEAEGKTATQEQATPAKPEETPSKSAPVPANVIPLRIGLFTQIKCHFTMRPDFRPLEIKGTILHDFVSLDKTQEQIPIAQQPSQEKIPFAQEPSQEKSIERPNDAEPTDKV